MKEQQVTKHLGCPICTPINGYISSGVYAQGLCLKHGAILFDPPKPDQTAEARGYKRAMNEYVPLLHKRIEEYNAIFTRLAEEIARNEALSAKTKGAEARGFQRAIDSLMSEEAMKFAFSKYEATRCSKNDAHLTRQDWAKWLEGRK